MATIKLETSDLVQQQSGMMGELREFWKEGHLCDVVIKSNDGTEHRAHAAVLSAASKFLKNLLGGSFQEADQRRSGEPVEIAASDAAVSVLLDYIYGGRPEFPLDDSIELLGLADAYDMPQLAAAVEAALRGSLDKAPVATALKILRHAQGLHDLKASAEEKVIANFEKCTAEAAFLELSATQLGRILRREDLIVSREEEVLKGIFKWSKSCKDRDSNLGLLLQNVDFPALSSKNLARVRCFASSMGPNGEDLQREVDDALRSHKKRKATKTKTRDGFRPKRRCLQHWSPHLGASSEGDGWEVFSKPAYSLCWHDGAIYATTSTGDVGSIVRWKPGEPAQTVAGEGVRVAGMNDLGRVNRMCVLPDGNIIVADLIKRRLVRIQNGSGQLVMGDVEGLKSVFCSPNGIVYVVAQNGQAVQKLVGTELELVMVSEHLSAEMRFRACSLFVTSEEVVYFSDDLHGRVLSISPGQTEPVVVFQAPEPGDFDLAGLFVTESGTVYVADYKGRKVFAFHPEDATCTKVVECPIPPYPLLVQDGVLYVSMLRKKATNVWEGGVYEYSLPPELQLE